MIQIICVNDGVGVRRRSPEVGAAPPGGVAVSCALIGA